MKPFRLIAADDRTDQHSEEALAEFKERRILNEQLTPQGWLDWYTRWSKAGCSVTDSVTCAVVHNYIMRALLLQRDSSKTLVLRHVVDEIYRRMAETGLRFCYVEGFLFVMLCLKPEEDKPDAGRVSDRVHTRQPPQRTQPKTHAGGTRQGQRHHGAPNG